MRSTCSCTTCIVYVNLFKDRSFHDCCSFQKADAKVRTLKHIFQIFSEVFFYFSFFLFPRRLSCRKGGKKKKEEKKTGHRFLKEECQLALLSFSKAGAKVRTLKHNFQMFIFPRRLSCRKGGKKKKEEGPGTVSLKRMSTRAAFVFKSGCKGKDFKA
ncbi:hypothetical protein [Bacteroides uniformis]|uniref:Uncharacterized protein n=1 Tax=Bacteroides uniformis TaxID=820 RepID=A0A413WXW0_BACUN|nr:hypothetical protein [Bacteroides uniformis]RHB67622.1 hypothetical protein DW873_18950 [Bacteroides uniformis]